MTVDRAIKPHEVEVIGHEPVALACGFWLPEIDLGVERHETFGELCLQGGFVARRVARFARGGVERDERRDELAELVASRSHVCDDSILEGGTLGAHTASLCSLSFDETARARFY